MIRDSVIRRLPAAVLAAFLAMAGSGEALAQQSATGEEAQAPAKTRARTPMPVKPASETRKPKATPEAEPVKGGKKAGDKAGTAKSGSDSAKKGSDKSDPKAEKSDAKKGAQAAEKPGAKKGAAAPPGLKASPVATFGQWSVFAAGEGKDRICYAISQPEQRLPKTVARDGAYLFVTLRKPKNEIAIIMGFPLKGPGTSKVASNSAATAKTASVASNAGPDPQILIGKAKFPLIGKDKNAWVRDQEDEAKVIREMGKTPRLTIKAQSAKGEDVTDEYSLTGFGDAFKRTRDECK
jgi:hypothetical protein